MPAGPLPRLGHVARQLAAVARRRHCPPSRAGLRPGTGRLRHLGLLPRIRRRVTQRGDLRLRGLSRALLSPSAQPQFTLPWQPSRYPVPTGLRGVDSAALLTGGPGVVCAAVSPALDRLGLVAGIAAVVVGVTPTACEGDCTGAELVEVLAHAACGAGEDGVDGSAGLLLVVVLVVASVDALVALPEVVSGSADSAVVDPPEVEAEPTDETGAGPAGEPGGTVALGSRLATLALS